MGAARLLRDVGGHNREACQRFQLHEAIGSVVELMVSGRHRVDADFVHELDHALTFGECGKVGAVGHVSCVEREHVRGADFGARLI